MIQAIEYLVKTEVIERLRLNDDDTKIVRVQFSNGSYRDVTLLGLGHLAYNYGIPHRKRFTTNRLIGKSLRKSVLKKISRKREQ
jgi:hypothetical protein